MVEYLAFEMGPFPGIQYHTYRSLKINFQEVRRRHSLSRLQEIEMICTYLHAPVAIAYQKEIASDSFMGEIYRRLRC